MTKKKDPALKFFCPTCGALPGQLCFTSRMVPMPQYIHPGRRDRITNG